MFPECYLSYMNNFPRAIPVTPGSYPSSMPETFPMPSPEMFPQTMQEGEDMPIGEDTMGGGTMQEGTMPMPAPMPVTTPESPFEIQPGAPAVLSTEYTQGYLRTQIGKRMRVTFLLGTNQIQDREGILEKVGISYIILREVQTNNLTLADIYSIKFVVIFPTV
jgi:hypothetical protein